MDFIVEKNKCCGCSSCVNICPVNAITMMNDEKGFKYPVIDKNKCINCKKCEKVCPILTNEKEKEKKLIAYACYNINYDERLNSSSGGIFILLAKEIIKKQGVVFGAAFDKNYDVKHRYVEKEEELKQFMGSKYTQSFIVNSYKKAKEFLDNDRYVLFTGTPCQIEGLKKYLGKEYYNLYTQDIICHGVPSPKVWRKYLEYQKKIYNEEIKSISFRNKDKGWQLFNMKIKFKNIIYFKNHSDDIFMKCFLNNICLRESCYNCNFKKRYRNSDITLADYWGIENIHSELNDDKGISLVVINSKKGKELFKLIENNITCIETDLDRAIMYNTSMIKSPEKHKKTEDFFDNLDNYDLDVLVKKYIKNKSLITRLFDKSKRIIKNIIKSNQ